jgi:hypothetical protein
MPATDYDKALTAITDALTPAEADAIVASAGPRFAGAHAADILDMCWQQDAHLDIREPFWLANPDMVAVPAASLALLAVIRLRLRPTRSLVTGLMHRAGLAGPLRSPDVAALAAEVAELGTHTRSLSVVAADLGSPELAEALAHLDGDLRAQAARLVRLAGRMPQ